MQVSQLAQMKGKKPHGYKKLHALHQELVSSTFERVSGFTKCWFTRPKKIVACYCSDFQGKGPNRAHYTYLMTIYRQLGAHCFRGRFS